MECRLYSCLSNGHQIVLPDKKELILGRGPLTKIKDKKCSREQVALTADYEAKEIELRQLGRNPSAIGSTLIRQGDVHVLGPGGMFSFLQGKYCFSVQFVGNDNSPAKEFASKKCLNNKGLKNAFQSLRRSLSKESLSSTIRLSPVNSKVKDSKCNDEKASEDSESRCSSELTIEDLKGPSPESCPQVGSGKKRKRVGQMEDNVPTKLRKSLSGKMMSCVSGKPEEVNLNDLLEEFGDAIMKEIEIEKEQLNGNLIMDGKDSSLNDVPLEDLINEAPLKCSKNTWVIADGLMVFSGKNLDCREKVACFDLDGTIICTKSGKVFPTGADDWKLLFGNAKSKIKQLYDSNFKKGLGKWKVSVEGFQQRIEKIQDIFEVPIQCFVATRDDQFRKPVPGMWTELCSKYNGNEMIDITRSFYVGDAAGRPVNWTKGKKKDFSCADRCFAANIGMAFHTPEEFFLNWNKSTFSWPTFNPTSVKNVQSLLHPECSNAEFSRKTQEIVVMVGPPACGKSTISKKHFASNGYEHVNRDTLGTWQKCVAACKAALSQGKSVIIDNTNPDKKTRQRYVEIAKAAQIPIRCFKMTTSFQHSLHNNKFRELTTNDKDYKHVGRIAFNTYKTAYQEPQLSEGFQAIVKVNFVPYFKNKKEEKLYFSFLL